ncbi:MAG: hypothetical protein ACOVQ6_09530 [Brevundimonas sp.]|jgi:hypothetical protein
MKHLRANGDLRAVMAMLMLIVWSGQVLNARQVSPPPGSGTATNCEAERDERFRTALRDYLAARAGIDRKKAAAIASCQDTFNNVDLPDCARKYDSQMKVLLASVGTGTMVCAAMCVVVVTPAGATVAPSCATCIGALYTVVAGGFVKALTDFNDCVGKATASASVCGRDATRSAEVAAAEAQEEYDRRLMDAMNRFIQCKEGTGG